MRSLYAVLIVSLLAAPAFAAPICAEVWADEGAQVKIVLGRQTYETGLPAVTPEEFANDTFGQNFVRLAADHELLSQDDPRLVKEGLAFGDKGGICGPTCITNIAKTADMKNPNERSVDEILKDVLTAYAEIDRQHDPRMGTQNPKLLTVAAKLPELKNAKITSMDYRRLTVENMAKMLPGDASRVMASSVQFEDGSGHELVILKLDPKTQTLVVGDPNYPGNVYATPYRLVQDQQGNPIIQFLLIGRYSEGPNLLNWVALLQGGLIEFSN